MNTYPCAELGAKHDYSCITATRTLFKVAGAHEYHYKPDFLLTVFLYLSAGQKLQTCTTQLFYDNTHCL